MRRLNVRGQPRQTRSDATRLASLSSCLKFVVASADLFEVSAPSRDLEDFSTLSGLDFAQERLAESSFCLYFEEIGYFSRLLGAEIVDWMTFRIIIVQGRGWATARKPGRHRRIAGSANRCCGLGSYDSSQSTAGGS